VLLPFWAYFLRDAAEKRLLSFQRKHVLFRLFFCLLTQGIVSGLCWCKTLQECLDAVFFIIIIIIFFFFIEELFESLCCCVKIYFVFWCS
jgi:hypothetical protein